MRLCLCLLFTSLLLACAPSSAETMAEHAEYAGMQSAVASKIYEIAENGACQIVEKQLPMQVNMEAYALSFVLPNSDVQYTVTNLDGLATVDIQRFPAFPDAKAESDAITGVVNTLLSCPSVSSIALLFDGEALPHLPHGTEILPTYNALLPMD